jgi:putative glutamine amidotransferase
MPRRIALTFRDPAKAGPYADALRLAGAEPVLLQAGAGAARFAGCDALLLSGGTDVDPARYGAARDPRTQAPDPERDEMELRLLGEAIAAGAPVLAICRGMQLFNVFHGGALRQHVEGHVVRPADLSEPAHAVRIAPGSRLAAIVGAGDCPVNSRHHQCVERVGEGLAASARALDGIVEAVERPDLRFAVAVQWHPENQVLRDARQLALFEALTHST